MLVTSTSHLYDCDRITAIEIQRTYFSSEISVGFTDTIKLNVKIKDRMYLCTSVSLPQNFRKMFFFFFAAAVHILNETKRRIDIVAKVTRSLWGQR